MIQQFALNPGASIPKACGSWAETKAAYRALGSEEISAEEIRLAHARATVERMKGMERVLVLQDTMTLSYNTCPQSTGLGPVGKAGTHGLLVHSGLAVTPEGLPLGIVYQQVWARDKEERKRQTRRKRLVEEKESFRWLETVDAVESLLPKDLEVWVAGDREADLFELFAMPRRPGLHLVVRAAHDRKVDSEEAAYLHAAAERAPQLGEMEVAVPRSRKRQARTAKLRVQACTLELVPPRNHLGRKDLSPIPVSVVRVRESGTVPEGEEPIEWMLISTVPVCTLARAVEVVEAYAQRWKIERYHYVLKSGCRVEKLQLENAERIERALSIYNVVAWRLLYMTYVLRVAPELPCTAVLEDDEWQALYVVGSRRPGRLPEKAPTIREAVRMIAMLGGFLGRKGDGEPGIQSIWTGFRRLMDFTLALRRLRASSTLVGNG
jgi:transposase Tn5 family protein/transposase-like protein